MAPRLRMQRSFHRLRTGVSLGLLLNDPDHAGDAVNYGSVVACGECRDSISTISRERAARKHNIRIFTLAMQGMIAREGGYTSSWLRALKDLVKRPLALGMYQHLRASPVVDRAISATRLENLQGACHRRRILHRRISLRCSDSMDPVGDSHSNPCSVMAKD
jgi:hypothetical protein